jgi:putative nucleotidyltransferase with HDIG domain
MRTMALVASGAMGLALIGSLWLARTITGPIGHLSQSLEAVAQSRNFASQLPRSGSSRELDALSDTFNDLMASVSAAEAETEAAYTGAIRALAAALDARDPYTAGHSERVSVLSIAAGRTLGLSEGDLEVLRLGALLHDIGKIGVPDALLRKAGTLTDAEYEQIKQHPVLGARILRPVPFLARHIPIVELHHERPDGRGYPYGLLADATPLAARIVHVADAYDAMTSARAYRGARSATAAVDELRRHAGTGFDAAIVDAFVESLGGLPGLSAQEARPKLSVVRG